MQNKIKDVQYCGVDKEKIKLASPKLNEKNVEIFYNWLVERYQIHLKKDVQKLPFPWTDDKILQKYRFTNVRREQDKETKWLIKNICNNQKVSYENKLLNIILFRLINKSSTINLFGTLDFTNIDLGHIKEKLEKFKEQNLKYVYFSNAFFTSSQKKIANEFFPDEKNMIIKMIKLVLKYKHEKIVEKIKNTESQKEVFDVLKLFKGIGNFLAYQIFVDYTYIEEFPFSENEFVIAGPGCINGLKLIFEDLYSLSYEEALFWLRDNQKKIFEKYDYRPEKLFSDLPKNERLLSVMSLENCMCEISKYIRAKEGRGRPRMTYRQDE